MDTLKFCLLASLMAIAIAEPPPQNGYSYPPPSNQLGYPTPTPSRPNNGYLPPLETSPRPRPPSSSYRPPPTQRPRPSPTYGPPPTQRPRPPPTPAPSYGPPPTARPRPPASSYGPPSLSGDEISPIGLRPQRPQPTRRPQQPSSTYGPPADDHHSHEPGMPYDFQYAVRDADFGNDFSQNEKSDGNVITGEYRVLLPDGRTQIVRYTADWQNGYNAEVIYEGEARYPESQSQIDSQGQRPGYNYNAPSRSFNPSG